MYKGKAPPAKGQVPFFIKGTKYYEEISFDLTVF